MFNSNKISFEKKDLIIKAFSLDIPASKTAVILDLNRKTVDRYYSFLQHIILEKGKELGKEISSNDPHSTEEPVIAMQEKNGKILVTIQAALAKNEHKALMKMSKVSQKILKDSPYFERWKSYQAIIVNYYSYFVIEHARYKSNAHAMNLSQLFLNFLKRRIVIFNGVARHHYLQFIKNSEFMFNHRNDNLYELLLQLLAEKGYVLTSA